MGSDVIGFDVGREVVGASDGVSDGRGVGAADGAAEGVLLGGNDGAQTKQLKNWIASRAWSKTSPVDIQPTPLSATTSYSDRSKVAQSAVRPSTITSAPFFFDWVGCGAHELSGMHPGVELLRVRITTNFRLFDPRSSSSPAAVSSPLLVLRIGWWAANSMASIRASSEESDADMKSMGVPTAC